jgi:TPR repeat protein
MMMTRFRPARGLITGVLWCLGMICGSASAEPFSAGLKALEREHYATAFRAWQGLAEDGESEAQNNIAYLYEHGYGVKQSYTRAIEWYKKAAAQDSAEAKHNLGMLAFNGYGMRQDYMAAKRYFTDAASQELPDSHYMLGLIYYQGHGVKTNPARAREHFLDAAKLGNPLGQFMTALMFQGGEGHPAEKTEPLKAFIWGMVSKMQLSKSVQEKATELARSCFESGYTSCPS